VSKIKLLEFVLIANACVLLAVTSMSLSAAEQQRITTESAQIRPVQQSQNNSSLELTEAEKFAKWKASLKPEMLAQGADQALVDKVIDSLTYIAKVIKLDRHQPEGRMTHEEYLTKVIPQWKVERARKEYKANLVKLKQASVKTGVPPHYIVSLWGKETNFGTITGNYSVPSALATLAFDGRRAKFFRKELMAAVKILAQGHIELEEMKGSWAGAMGNCQFMPSSFLQFAVDANGDGKKNIWSDKDDIFASMGNYLSRYGWDKTKTWGRQISLTKPFNQYQIGKKHAAPLSYWQQMGVRRMNGSDLPNADINAYLIAPGGEKGRIYLVYPNFDIIMKWNRSHYFATGVGYLADRIAYPKIQ
jgi:membrane-bound lytic murein transglycosylase B